MTTVPQLHRNEGVLFFEDHGAGPPLLLAHSFLCSLEMWAPQIPRLAESHRVINVDLRGHGRSAPAREPFTLYDLVEDLSAILDHLDIERAIWGGLSIGGMIALRAALRIPNRVRGLMLLDTHAGEETFTNRLRYRAMSSFAALFGLGALSSPIQRTMFGATSRETLPAMVQEWTERMTRSDVRSMRLTLRALCERDSVTERLGEISVPALVLVGQEDESLPPNYSEAIAAGIPDAHLVVVPACGHLSTLEQPDAVEQAMVRFLEVV